MVFFVLFLLLSPSYALFGDFTIQDEVELGRELKVYIDSHFPVIQDPEVVGYVNNLIREVQLNMPPQPFPIKISVLRDKSINAFAAPAGYIFVNSGLMLALENESQLAAILAHELAHVSQRHLAKNIKRSKLLNIGTLVGVLAGALIGQSSEAGEALAIGSMAGGQAAALKYSRDDEREADQIGLRYLVDSGFSPQGMVEAFEKIRRLNVLSGTGKIPSYMQTHPGLDERIGYIQNVIRRLPKPNKKGSLNSNRLKRVQMILRARYSNPESAMQYYEREEKELSCLELLGKGIVMERLNNISQAKKVFEKVDQCGGNDPLWLREAGRFHFQLGNFELALSFLNKALSQDPTDYMASFFKARVLAQLGKFEQAIPEMKLVLRYVPEDSEVHYFLGRIWGKHGNQFQGYLHFAYAALFNNNQLKTKSYFDKAKSLANKESEKEKIAEFERKMKARSKYW